MRRQLYICSKQMSVPSVCSRIGDKFTEKFKNMFNIKQEKNTLSNTLSKYGYTNENITHIILTHLHFDHSGGAVSINNEGDLVPAFPNAQYFISEKN